MTHKAFFKQSLATLEVANDGLKKSLFYFIETILTEMAHCGASDDLFKRSSVELTKPPTFIEAFKNFTLASSRYVCPVVKNICAKTEKKHIKAKKSEKSICRMLFPDFVT